MGVMSGEDNIQKPLILLVEDQAIIAMAQAGVLENAGYRVVTALTGEEAVDIATRDGEVDLVLMDINLGRGMDGTEAAEQILTQRELPIVFLTAYSDRETVERVRGITRYGYVVKNSGDFVLLSSVETALDLFDAHQRAALNERRFRRAQQLARVASYERDFTSGHTIWSEELYRLLGDPDTSPSREAILERMHPEDRPAAEQAVAEATGRDDGFDIHYRIVRADGGVRWVRDRAEYWRDGDGAPVRIFGVLQDITDYVETRTSLRMTSEELDLSLAAAGIILWRYDPQKRTIEYRGGPERQDRVPRPDTVDGIRDVVHPDDMPALERGVNALIAGEARELEVTYRIRSDGDSWIRLLTRGRVVSTQGTGSEVVLGASLVVGPAA